MASVRVMKLMNIYLIEISVTILRGECWCLVSDAGDVMLVM